LPGPPAVQHGPPDARYVKHSSIRATRVHPRRDRRKKPSPLRKNIFPSGRVDSRSIPFAARPLSAMREAGRAASHRQRRWTSSPGFPSRWPVAWGVGRKTQCQCRVAGVERGEPPVRSRWGLVSLDPRHPTPILWLDRALERTGKRPVDLRETRAVSVPPDREGGTQAGRLQPTRRLPPAFAGGKDGSLRRNEPASAGLLGPSSDTRSRPKPLYREARLKPA